MPKSRRAIPAFLIFLVTISAIFAVLYLHKTRSKIYLGASQDIFHVKFNIARGDLIKSQIFLEKAKLPAALTAGFNFGLDSTSSAALAFALPQEADLNIGDSKVSISGKYQGPKLKTFQLDAIKIPKSTNLAIAGYGLDKFLSRHYQLPDEFLNLLSGAAGENPNYLLLFDTNSDFALIFKSNYPFIDSLKSIGLDHEIYKQEQFDPQLELHLIKVKDNNQEAATLTLFELDNRTFLTSSRQSAELIIKIYRNQDSYTNFNLKNGTKDAAFALIFNNDRQEVLTDNFYRLMFFTKTPSFASSIQNLQYLEFLLKKDSFSGLIELK